MAERSRSRSRSRIKHRKTSIVGLGGAMPVATPAASDAPEGESYYRHGRSGSALFTRSALSGGILPGAPTREDRARVDASLLSSLLNQPVLGPGGALVGGGEEQEEEEDAGEEGDAYSYAGPGGSPSAGGSVSGRSRGHASAPGGARTRRTSVAQLWQDHVQDMDPEERRRGA